MSEKKRSALRFHVFCPVLALCLAVCILLSGCGTGLVHPSADPSTDSDVSVPAPEPTPDEIVGEAAAKLRAALFGWTAESPAGRLSEWKDSNTVNVELDCPSFKWGGETFNLGKLGFNYVKNGDDVSLKLDGLLGERKIDLAVLIVESVLYLSLNNVTDKPVRLDPDDLKDLQKDLFPSGGDDQSADPAEDSVFSAESLKGLKDKFSQLLEEYRKTYEAVPFVRSDSGEESADPDGVTVFTKVWDKAQMTPLFDLLKEIFETLKKADEQLPDIKKPDESSDDTYQLERTIYPPIKTELTVTMAKEDIRSVSYVLINGLNRRVLEFNLTVSSAQDRKSVKAVWSGSDGPVVELDYTVKPESGHVQTDIKATVHLGEGDSFSAETSLRWDNLSETSAAFSGEVTVLVKKDGALAGIPVSVEGQINQKGDILSESLHVGLNVKDAIQADFTLNASFSTTDAAVSAPEDSISVKEIMKDPSGVIQRFSEAFPELFRMFGQSDYGIDVYRTEGQEATVYIDRVGKTVTVSAYVPYQDTGKALKLTSPTNAAWTDEIPYTLGSDGTITLLGRTMDIYRTEEYITYYEETDEFYFELYPSEGYAYVDFTCPLDNDEEFVVIPGGARPISMTVDWAVDRQSFKFKEGTTFYYTGWGPYEDVTDL